MERQAAERGSPGALGYRKVLKNLNNKLETMGGVLDENDDDIARIINNMLTAAEHLKASAVKQLDDDDKGDHEFTTEQLGTLDEDLGYILNDKLEGSEPRGNLKGLREGDGLQAWRHRPARQPARDGHY